MLDLLPEWLRNGIGDDAAFWLGYLTNGKHLGWYASIQYTLFAAVAGGIVALALGLAAAAARNNGPLPLRLFAAGYINVVRGVPDVLFFLFFPLAFEQAVEWFTAARICTPDMLATNAGLWPPCDAANWRLGTGEYLILASISLGIVYGAFTAGVISGALRAVPAGQLEAARAFGMTRSQIFWRIHVRQMWIYALPGLSNVWLLLIKATALLSLLQIIDIVAWAQRLGAANFSRVQGLIHPDWRWQYFLVLLFFYMVLTYVSEAAFAAVTERMRRGLPIGEGSA